MSGGIHADWGDEWCPEDEEEATKGEPPQRLRRAELVLSQRCGDVLLVLDKVCDKHNILAVMRTAEALGVQNMWTIAPSYIKNLDASDVCGDVPDAEVPSDVPPHAQVAGDLHMFMDENNLGIPAYGVENVSPKGFGDLWRVSCTLPDGTTFVGKADHVKKVAMRYAAEAAMKHINPAYRPRVSSGFANQPPKMGPAPTVSVNKQRRQITTSISKGADRWLSMRDFATSAECLAALREGGWTIWATALGPTAIELSRDMPQSAFPQKLAVVIGAEVLGVSDEILAACDRQMFLPMYGFTESLNLSVATAMILQRVFDRKYQDVPLGERGGVLSAGEKNAIRAEWWDCLATNPTARKKYDEFAADFHSADLAPLDSVRDQREDDRKTFAEQFYLRKHWKKHVAPVSGEEEPTATASVVLPSLNALTSLPSGPLSILSQSQTPGALPMVGAFIAGVTASIALQKALVHSRGT